MKPSGLQTPEAQTLKNSKDFQVPRPGLKPPSKPVNSLPLSLPRKKSRGLITERNLQDGGRGRFYRPFSGVTVQTLTPVLSVTALTLSRNLSSVFFSIMRSIPGLFPVIIA